MQAVRPLYLTERNHAVVNEIRKRIHHISHKCRDAVAGYDNTGYSEIILADNTLRRDGPYDPQLEKIADEETDDKPYGFAHIAAVGFEYPAFVAEERIHHTGYITENIAQIEIPAQKRLAYIDHAECDKSVKDTHNAVFDELQHLFAACRGQKFRQAHGFSLQVNL